MGQASRGLLDDEDVADAAKDVDVAFTINPEYAARLEVPSLVVSRFLRFTSTAQ